MELVIDMREKSLMQQLDDKKLIYKTACLDVGDIQIQDASGAPVMILERKALADFAASHVSNRYREQRVRILASKGAGVLVGYVIEGYFNYNGTERSWYGEVMETQLKTLAHRLQLRYGIPVFQTKDVQGTAGLVGHLFAILQKDRNYFKASVEEDLANARLATSYTTNFSQRRSENVKPAVAMLMGIKGVSLARAEALLASATNINTLCQYDADKIANVKAGAQRIGPKLGALIYNSLHGIS